VSNVLKFLFPEYQIFSSIGKHGFIGKKKPNSQNIHTQNNATVPVVAGGSAMLAQKQKHAVTAQPSQSTLEKNTYERSGSKAVRKLSDAQIDAKIMAIRSSVMASVIGQDEAVDKIIIALKRPIVAGCAPGVPRNTFFIVGSVSSGRHTLLSSAVNAARHENLLANGQVSKVNLALYPTAAERPLFLSDIYKAMYDSTDLVLFENFEHAHADVLSIISSLATSGTYKFSDRYILQNGNLVQATGTLTQALISEICANEKYFAFITNASQSKLENSFGTKFMNKIDDIISMASYSDDAIADVTVKIFADLNKKVQSNLSFEISVSDSFFRYCLSMYRKPEGFKSIQNYVLNDVYRGLSEFKLRNFSVGAVAIRLDYDTSQGMSLTYTKDNVTDTISLEPFMPKLNTGNIDEIKAELEAVIGLDKVKEFVMDLENNLKMQQMRAEAGHKVSSISNHMIFTGNPGTGKTTIARIVAKYLKAIGLLSTGQLREVSRPDLVGQYVGQTAKQTNEVIQSALGGVLFIDEAYGICRDQHDTFGREAVDAIVKAVEDYRDQLVAIMAGYSDEMQEFMKNNPGLKSRFPHVIDFADYSADEMVRIASLVAKSKGYRIADECAEGLAHLFERSQVKGRNDGGNGRLARNVVEAAILGQSGRIAQNIKQISFVGADDNPPLDILSYTYI